MQQFEVFMQPPCSAVCVENTAIAIFYSCHFPTTVVAKKYYANLPKHEVSDSFYKLIFQRRHRYILYRPTCRSWSSASKWRIDGPHAGSADVVSPETTPPLTSTASEVRSVWVMYPLCWLPSRVVVGLVTNKAFNGHAARNPFNFQHFNLSKIALNLDGQQQHTIRPMQPDYEHGMYIRAYDSLYAGTGKLCRDEWEFISLEDCKCGYALYAFDLSADMGEHDHLSLVHQGSVLVLKFGVALAAAVSVVAYAGFENIIEVDRDRNIVFDYGVWIRTRLIVFWELVCVTLTECLASTICPKIVVCWCAIQIPPTNSVVIGLLSTSEMIAETFRFVWTLT